MASIQQKINHFQNIAKLYNLEVKHEFEIDTVPLHVYNNDYLLSWWIAAWDQFQRCEPRPNGGFDLSGALILRSLHHDMK